MANDIISNLANNLVSKPNTASSSPTDGLRQQFTSRLIAAVKPPTGGFGGATDLGKDSSIVGFARQQIGKPYKWGAASGDTRWFDCSSLVQWAANQAGIQVPRTTWEQMKLGAAVAGLAGAQPGDLLFFNGGSHVGIYVGNGQMIDAPHTGAQVRQEPVWQNQLTSIRRL